MHNSSYRIFPVEKAGVLQGWLRKIFQNPVKILKPYIREGMTVLDMGCGPGFFAVPAAEMVGESGKVIAADLQQGMLDKLREKIKHLDVRNRILLHKCPENSIGVAEKVDLFLAFQVVHEVMDPESFFKEVKSMLKPGGVLYIIEPSFVVSRKDFKKTLALAGKIGFISVGTPKIFMGRSAVLK